MSRSRSQAVAGRRAAATRRHGRQKFGSAAAVVALVLAGLLGWLVYQSQRGGDVPTPAHASADGTGLVDGAGPVTVEVWLDPHCPHCRTFEEQAGPTLDQLVTDGAITRIYHPVAFLDRFSTTKYSTRAAASIGCAADEGAHVPYLETLLAAQPPAGGPGLSDAELVEVGVSAGTAGPGFAGCVTDGRYRDWIERATAAAAEADVTGTPTVRVNGTDVTPAGDAIVAAVRAAGAGAG
ncbi:MAG TPA: thioredoxin domain-containing protein [Natronosporangium sp.]